MGFPGTQQHNSIGMDLELSRTCGIMMITNLLWAMSLLTNSRSTIGKNELLRLWLILYLTNGQDSSNKTQYIQLSANGLGALKLRNPTPIRSPSSKVVRCFALSLVKDHGPLSHHSHLNASEFQLAQGQWIGMHWWSLTSPTKHNGLDWSKFAMSLKGQRNLALRYTWEEIHLAWTWRSFIGSLAKIFLATPHPSARTFSKSGIPKHGQSLPNGMGSSCGVKFLDFLLQRENHVKIGYSTFNQHVSNLGHSLEDREREISCNYGMIGGVITLKKNTDKGIEKHCVG